MDKSFLRKFSLFTLVCFVFSFVVAPVSAAVNYTYDANGNMTSDGTKCSEYNEANQVKLVKNCSNNQTIAEYIYDHEGNRVVKKEYESGSLKRTVYSPNDEYETVKLASNSATQNTAYYHVNSDLIAKKNPDGTKNYYHNDHLGSSSVTTNQSGNLVEQTKYDPWGEVTAGGTKSKYQYTGQEKDSETGLNYYGARYYDSHIRRFTQADDVIQDPYNPQSLNRYSYVNNNPVRYTDPSGHFVWIPVMIVGAGAALGATAAVSDYVIDHPTATVGERARIAAGGAVAGGVTSAVALVDAPVLAVIAIGAIASGSQQVNKNVVAQQPLGKNVGSQMVNGAIFGVAMKGVTGLNLLPKTVGRPIDLNKSRSFISSFNRNSKNAFIRKNAPDLISYSFGVIQSSLDKLFPKNKIHKKA